MTRHECEYERWLNFADQETVKELEELRGKKEEIEYLFSQNLAFGTGGLRGVMRAGLYAMNIYTVGAATKGLADYLLEHGGKDRGVVIGYDSRLHSEEFAKTAASVLAACGIKTYIFDELRPTPMVSFAVRHFGCIAGVNVTASHNPKEYNGYKVYYEDGAQISPEQAKAISACINSTDVFSVKRADFDDAVREGKIVVVGKDFDEIYLSKVIAEQVDPAALPAVADELKVVYTPFHGAGWRLVPEVLHRTGLKHLYIVPEQAAPDGNFPTVKSPNPENPEGFACGIELARKVDSDLIVATDPDCDRVGVMAKNKNGEFETISGNCMGGLLLDYILSAHTKNGTMPPEPYAVKTIVSTDLANAICEKFGVKLYEVLTGFKFIGEVIKKSEEAGHGSFILGFEESYGYLKGTYARDKDGVVASMLIVEMAAYYRQKGMTLIDAKEEMYRTYGYFAEYTENVQMQGLDALVKMRETMARVRKEPPKEIGGKDVVRLADCLMCSVVDRRTGALSGTGLPPSDVLAYTLEDGSRVILRPSGTEPKIKAYFLCRGKTREEADACLASCRESFGALLR